mgnify:CR=1 FL=1
MGIHKIISFRGIQQGFLKVIIVLTVISFDGFYCLLDPKPKQEVTTGLSFSGSLVSKCISYNSAIRFITRTRDIHTGKAEFRTSRILHDIQVKVKIDQLALEIFSFNALAFFNSYSPIHQNSDDGEFTRC